MAASVYPGEFCKSAGIKCADLASLSPHLPKLCENELTKGVVLEMCNYCNDDDYSWEDLYAWLRHLISDKSLLPLLPTIKVKISRIRNSLIKLKRNKKKENIPNLLNEPFIKMPYQAAPLSTSMATVNPSRKLQRKSSKSKPVSSDVAILSDVNKKMAQELLVASDSLAAQDIKIAELTSKLKTLSVRNVNKKIRRRNVQILLLKEKAKRKSILETRLQQTELYLNRQRAKFQASKKRTEHATKQIAQLQLQVDRVETDLNVKADGFEAALSEFKGELNAVRMDREKLFERVSDLESKTISTKEHERKYNDSVRQCCMELLSMNVGINNVEPIIRSVLSFEVPDLLKSSTLENAY